jgi:2-polyprenyl-6-methoxyphenol hydroxylase-like FAD-dependent oxidoreductase
MNAGGAPSDGCHVVVVGGSLAGLVTVLALAHRGVRATMVERAPGERRDAAVLSVNETELARTLGGDRARTALRRTALAVGGEAVTWHSLQAGLLDVARADPMITLRHGVRVQGVGQDADRAWVTTDGGEPVAGSAVVGADGHRSMVRRCAFPDHPDATYAGYTLWSGEAGEADMPDGLRWPTNLNLFPSRGYYLLGTPLVQPDEAGRPGRRQMSWGWYDATRDAFLRRSGAVRGTVVRRTLSDREIPEEIYDGLAADARLTWLPPWREATLDSIARRAVICTPITEYVPTALARGRIALVGDAAHVPTPMTGKGFGASVTDARVLAEELASTAPTGTDAALGRYERLRLEEVRDLVIVGQRFSRSFAADLG